MAMKICVYADVNVNLIDGSTIWLQSLATTLSLIDDVEVSVLLDQQPTSDLIVQPLIDRSIEVLALQDVIGRSDRSAAATARGLGELREQNGFDLFIVRGRNVIDEILDLDSELSDHVWVYWLDPLDISSPASDPRMLAILESFPKIIVQSFAQKTALESVFHVPAAKVIILTPMVPDFAWDIGLQSRPAGKLVLGYSGKLDAQYNVEEYLDLPSRLEEHGVNSKLLVLGDKFNRDDTDPEFSIRMRSRLESADNVEWLGGLIRHAAMREIANADVGMCVRKPSFDASLEISTKLLEFCAIGVPPVVNRTAAHEMILGADYPLYANDMDELLDVLISVSKTPGLLEDLRSELREKAKSYSFSAIAKELDANFKRAKISRPKRSGERRKIVFAGHDFKFLEGALPSLEADPGLEIRFDKWKYTKVHDPKQSQELLNWADTVFCEWCSGAAIWYSNNADESKRVIIRLHRFELFTDAPKLVNFANVDRLIVVSDYFKQECIKRFDVDAAKIDVVPQFVDSLEFRRPKHPWAAFTMGFVGVNDFDHKRVDRAVDLLNDLRREEPRWRMRIRSVMPWHFTWIWEKDAQANKFRTLFSRIEGDSDLRDSIVFDTPGPDMAEWFRNVSFIVSTSESEGCHTSVAEGLASGACPLVLNWPGASSVYSAEYVGNSIEDLATVAKSHVGEDGLVRDEAKYLAEGETFDVSRTVEHFTEILTSADPAKLPPKLHLLS